MNSDGPLGHYLEETLWILLVIGGILPFSFKIFLAGLRRFPLGGGDVPEVRLLGEMVVGLSWDLVGACFDLVTFFVGVFIVLDMATLGIAALWRIGLGGMDLIVSRSLATLLVLWCVMAHGPVGGVVQSLVGFLERMGE
jgi:hypothetical protein